MLKRVKIGTLRLAESTGVSHTLAGSEWRRRRLLILCFHGVSMNDEHECFDLYITAASLRHRMEMLVEAGCNVLPLGEAVERLREGSLPPRAAAITFDDGFYDFYALSFPIVESFGFPVTLYLTTYYMEYNHPVFDPMCSYLLWKGRQQERLEWPEVLGEGIVLDEEGRLVAFARIMEYAVKRKLSGPEKDNLLRQLAERLNLDYAAMCRRRVLDLLPIDEAKSLVARGVDVQYHTHRHREYRSRDRMLLELDDNRRRIALVTDVKPRHFCYTGGFYLPEHIGYLREYGILSATTCKPGLCTPKTDSLLLPRLVDTERLSDLEFRAWLAGTADLIPQRPYRMSGWQLGDEEPAPAQASAPVLQER